MDRETLRTKLVTKIQGIIDRWGRWMSEEDIALAKAEIKTYQEDTGVILDTILANLQG